MPQPDPFQQIRSQFEKNPFSPSVKRGAACGGKVIARNRDWFVSEKPEKSREDYERRAGHRRSGFFALPHVPYRPFAGLKYTEAYNLIEEQLKVSVPLISRAHRANTTGFQSAVGSDGDRLCSKASSHAHIRVVRDKTSRKVLAQSRTAGLSAIRLYLGSSDRSIKEVEAGSAFRDAQEREEERKEFLLKMRAPKITRKGRTGQECAIHNPSLYLPPLVHTTSSRMCLTSNRPAMRQACEQSVLDQGSLKGLGKGLDRENREEGSQQLQQDNDAEGTDKNRRVGPNLYVALAAAHFKLNNATPGRSLGQKKGISPAKLLLRRSCLVKVKAVYAVLCSLHNMKLRELRNKRPLSMASIKHLSLKPLAVKENHDSHHPPHYHLHLPHLGKFGGHTPTYHTSHPHNLHPHKHNYHPLSHHVEAWEDLLMIERSCDPRSLPATPTNIDHHPKHNLSLPPWQKQVVYVDSDEDRPMDPAKVIAECMYSFQNTKNKISEQISSLLTKRQQSSARHLSIKLQELRPGPNTEECLQEMREKVYQVSRDERAAEENRPAWYCKLEKEVEAAFSSHSSGARTMPLEVTARNLMDKLKYFLYTDIDSIPRVTEKLCLLVMSLPSNQLCLQPTIAAIQFVLEDILDVPAGLCQQWLEMRRLPLNSVNFTSEPVIVFGLTV